MAYVEITLKHEGDEYIVEVDNTSSPEKLCGRLVKELDLSGNYRLSPVTSLNFDEGSTWELFKVAESDTIRGELRLKKK